MPYLSTYEQKALEEGLEKGREEGRQEGIRQGILDALRQTLEVRFGEVPEWLLNRIEPCQDIDLLQALHKRALTARSPDELQV